jgi:hypothetical protein
MALVRTGEGAAQGTGPLIFALNKEFIFLLNLNNNMQWIQMNKYLEE